MIGKKKQPARMNRYTNLAGKKTTTPHQLPRKRQRRWPAWFSRLSLRQKVMVIATPILVALIIIPLVTYAYYAKDIGDKDRLMNRNNTGIVLTDKDGQAFYSRGRAEHRTLVPLSNISPDMQHALIASEDKDFYKHGGFNLLSIFRAAFTRVGGGSTLTQQLAKNTLLSDQHSFLRKYQELFMSIAIEQKYSKNEILEMYLNSVYFGENAFGIEDAAKAYFNKAPKDLDLAESAMLVGLLPAPSAYSPISGVMEYAKQRQNTVLSRMVTNGYISDAEKTNAAAEALSYGSGANSANSIAPHFAEMVIKELSDKYGYETVMRSGYQVRTSLDRTAQTSLNDSLQAGMKHITAMGGSNASGIVIDPKNGQIRALVGSADYSNADWGKVNMVTTSRQPGSSFKPIYYAAALADGVITPATILHDKPTDFGNYAPLDADKKFRGDISVRKAISQSLNIPSVEVMQKYGINKSIAAANNLGISTISKDKNYGLALALGVAEAPLMKMTNAYAAFANQGQQFTPTLITQINDKFSKQIFGTSGNLSKQAISKEGAYLISNILSDNAARAPIFGSSLTVSGHTVAVKTGTTEENHDAWTIGYTPSYAVGVWVGNNDNSVMRSGGSDMAGPIWRGTMTKLLQGLRDEPFTIPSGIVQKPTCTNGGIAARTGTNTFNEYFVAGALPTITCNSEQPKITVCNLDTMQIETINESDFTNEAYSKDIAQCQKKTIQACDLQTGTVVAINESDYDSTKYSKDITNCQAKPKKVSACDTTTGKIVQIDQSQLDGVRYTQQTDPTKCAVASSAPSNGQ